MREEVRDIERLNHMIEAINVLVNYKEHHSLEDAKSDPVVYSFKTADACGLKKEVN